MHGGKRDILLEIGRNFQRNAVLHNISFSEYKHHACMDVNVYDSPIFPTPKFSQLSSRIDRHPR